ncbi:hypothetical protein KVC_1396 [Ketogulonicigenium vulgare]|nr:hypothetical protein KVC_1396 [Ketogulonicigenium vulgare]
MPSYGRISKLPTKTDSKAWLAAILPLKGCQATVRAEPLRGTAGHKE